ncbi:MAG: recombination regulator RecX [Candidatus Eremiobacteraeota bacterium]|nr:recombination regulator RecX [Candidatus Eremiobacteraeota bacterium]
MAALRVLAQRRLTEAQLWTRLASKGYSDDDVRAAVAACKRDGFVDDAVFAQLFVDGRGKSVGNARLVAELVRRGIERESAQRSVAAAERAEDERLHHALEKLFRTRASLSYPSAARALERLGFPAPAIYRHLRARALSDMAGNDAPAEDSFEIAT